MAASAAILAVVGVGLEAGVDAAPEFELPAQHLQTCRSPRIRTCFHRGQVTSQEAVSYTHLTLPTICSV
eukprot:12689911-Alexandrium_andersonii.AAC.1